MTDTTRAVARYDGPRSTPELREYALALAFDTAPDGAWKRNDSLPATFRGNPGAVAFAVEYAKALDVSPVTAIIGIHIVDGKPTASSGLISALVRRAGHKIRTWVEGSFEDGTAKGITTIHRADDPEFEYRSEWTLPRAVRAGLMERTDAGGYRAAKSRSAWATYPESMLKARSVTECARDAAEDAILGVHYTPEELGADVDETGEPVYTVTRVESVQTPAPSHAPAASPPADPPAAPSQAAETPAAAADAPAGPDLVALADAARAGILAARSLEELGDVWKGPEIDGQTSRANLLECGDENGQATTVLDLFKRAAAAIKSGTTLDGTALGDEGGEEGGTPAAGGTPDAPGGSGQGEDTPAADTGPENGAQAAGPEVGQNRADLDRIMGGLSEEQRAGVISFARLEGIDPTVSDDAAGVLVEAIISGEAFPAAAAPEDPLALVTRILGATTISVENVTDPEERHRRELAARRDEDRQDARAATPAGHGTRGGGRSAYEAARAALNS